MGLFNNFPYMDLSNLNLDFVLKKLKDLTNYTESAKQDANRAEAAKTVAVTAQTAAESAARSAESSARDAQTAETSAENYAAHIADPVSGLVTGWLDDNITPTTPPVDASLTIQGAAADAKATGDAINALIQSGGVPSNVKYAIDRLFNLIGVIGDTGADYSGYVAAIHAWAVNLHLLSISAVFNQGQNIVYDVDSIESLRDYLTVTAHYDDGTSAEVQTYTLTGDLEVGTSTITVDFEGQQTTFTVTVSPKIIYDVSGDDLTFTSLIFSTPYYQASNTRLSYYLFNLLIQHGKKYQIKAYTDVQTADMSVHIYNTTAVSRASQNQTIAGADADYAWRNSLEWVYDANTLINGKNPRAVRLSFKYDSSDSPVSTKFINRITIREVK